jgi:hypothetical protein
VIMDAKELAKLLDDWAYSDQGLSAKKKGLLFTAVDMIKEQAATLTKLPTTRDGVPIVPGMVLWDSEGYPTKVRKIDTDTRYFTDDNNMPRLAAMWFSTRAAAEAAAEKARKHHG